MKKEWKHSKEAKTITCESDSLTLRIFINGILHFYILKTELISFQSWYVNKNHCCIEIYTATKDIQLEYNSVEKWKIILQLLNDNL